MSDTITLVKGKTYYHAVFFDKDLSIPSIETYIYEGWDEEDGHLFINAEGYVAKQEGINDIEAYYIFFAKGTVMCIFDKEHLIEWLQEEHSPKLIGKTYEYVTI